MKKLLITSVLFLGLGAANAAAQAPGPAVVEAVPGEVSVRTLAKGLTFDATFKNQISSKSDAIGGTLTGVIVSDVKDNAGVVIFPANSVANVEIIDIKGTDKDNARGSLVLIVRSVNVGNSTFRMKAMKNPLNSEWRPESKKMETGVIGRAPKGTVEGTALLVAPGTPVTFELAEAVTVTS